MHKDVYTKNGVPLSLRKNILHIPVQLHKNVILKQSSSISPLVRKHLLHFYSIKDGAFVLK